MNSKAQSKQLLQSNPNPANDFSYVTLGGYDAYDIEDNDVKYMKVGEACDGCWNLTATNVTINSFTLLDSAYLDSSVISFQINYPYIGVPQYAWLQIYKAFIFLNPDYANKFFCKRGNGN